MKKYLCEFIGTAVLVLFGCGTAVVTGGFTAGVEVGFMGVLAIAMAFGLSIVAMAYVIGNVSGCHINPAVSLSMLISGKMSVKDFIGYVIAQIAGGFAGTGLLYLILSNTNIGVANLGANGFDGAPYNITMIGAIIVEIILTFVFIYTILGVTSDDKKGSVAGIVIGLTLAFVHIIGIPLTGTSVNPARSLAPAVILGGKALEQVWVFIVAPFVGSALAAITYKFLNKTQD